MDIVRRMYLSRIVEKIDNNRRFADKIGLTNKSKILINHDKNQEVRIK